MRRGIAAAPLLAFGMVILSAGAGSAADAPSAPAQTPAPAAARGPLPHYVSLRVAGANGRHGPGLEHQIDWIYQRPGLPLEVTAESGPWRRVRDPDGAEVWMHVQNLDARRTVYVASSADAPLRQGPSGTARPSALLAHGVVGSLTGCEGEWRRVAVGGRVGWVSAEALWGADDCVGL